MKKVAWEPIRSVADLLPRCISQNYLQKLHHTAGFSRSPLTSDERLFSGVFGVFEDLHYHKCC